MKTMKYICLVLLVIGTSVSAFGTTWERVTKISDLSSGDVVIVTHNVANGGTAKVMTTSFSSGKYGYVEKTISSNKITTSNSDGVMELTIKFNSNQTYCAFWTGSGWLQDANDGNKMSVYTELTYDGLTSITGGGNRYWCWSCEIPTSSNSNKAWNLKNAQNTSRAFQYMTASSTNKFTSCTWNTLGNICIWKKSCNNPITNFTPTTKSETYGGSNKTFSITATRSGSGTVTWSTNNSSVATVSNGTVTVKGMGTATITYSVAADANNGYCEETRTCVVTVTGEPRTITFKANGGTGSDYTQTVYYNTATTLKANSFTRSGYRFLGWNTDKDATTATKADKASVTTTTDITYYAIWKQQVTVTFKPNGGTPNTEYTQDMDVSTSTVLDTHSYSKTGYTFLGFNTNSAATTASYTSGNSYSFASNTDLFAIFQVKNYTVTLSPNGGSGSNQTVTTTYGSAMPTTLSGGGAIVLPTRDGYTFGGYEYNGTTYYDPEGASAHTWDVDGNVTLTAIWTTNTPNLAVASVDHIAISSTTPSVTEGNSTTYAYGSTVTLNHGNPTSGYLWAGWDVYETGNPGNKVTVTGNQFSMPDHNVTVSAIVYPEANIKAWCPVIMLTKTDDDANPILITSVSGQAIKAVRTLHLTVTGAPTTASVVTLNGNDLKFYADFSGTIREITSTNKLTCSSHALDKIIYVAYSPTGVYSTDSWNSVSISAACLNSDESEASSIEVADLVNVRRLPDNGTGSGQGFVIAAKVGGQWVAMPSSIIAGAQDGLPITVNDNEDPSSATLAPSSARYNLYNVYTSTSTNDRHKQYGDYAYLAGKGTKALKAAPSGVNISLGVNISTYSGGSEDAAYFEWLLSTTDKKNYTITNNARTPDKLKYYTTHDKFGMYSYNSQVITEFRLLPATFYEDAAAQIIEWKENSVVVMYTGSETTATTKVGTNAPSSPQTLANNKLTHGIYEFTTDQALTSNDGAILEISFGDGSTRKIEEIPIIITGNTSATTGRDGQNVIIRNGGKLTATATENENYYNIYVYGGGILDIPTGTTLGVNNIILRAGGLITSGIGTSPTVSYDNSYPQLGISGTLVSAENNIQYEYVTDYYNWYQLCLPFNAVLTSIHYPLEYYADNVLETNTGSWVIKRYDGATRATGEYNAWKDIEKDNPAKTEVTAGQGYIFWGAPKKLTIGSTTDRSAWGIQRMTMAITADAAKTAENADKNVSVAAHPATKANDDGWNLIGNPYMVNLKSMTTTGLHACKLEKELDANDNWTGKWVWNEETTVRYLTIPDAHFDTYVAKTVATAIGAGDLYPGRAFFVQIEGAATAITFTTENRADLLPAWRLSAKKDVDIETGIVMSDETQKDEVNFWIKDGKTAEYEYNADYPKTPNSSNFNIYGVHDHGDLSWIAISPEIAEGSMAIGYQVPAAGDYMLSLSETYVSDDIEHLFVTDHEASPEVTVDLVERDYIFHVNQAETNNTRFTVSIKLKDEDTGTTTGIDNLDVNSDVPTKFIYQDKMYILHQGVIYDATGKRVKVVNK